MAFVVLLIVAAVAAVVVFLLLRNRSANTSSVDTFRRHIDALGPEARRTTVDQVQNAAARNDNVDESADASPTDESSSGDDDTDEGGARGT